MSSFSTVDYCDAVLPAPPKASEWPCQTFVSLFLPSTPFSLPFLFRPSSSLAPLLFPPQQLRPAQQLFYLWISVRQPFHFAALCPAFDVTHTEKILFLAGNWSLRDRRSLANLSRGQMKHRNGCVSRTLTYLQYPSAALICLPLYTINLGCLLIMSRWWALS